LSSVSDFLSSELTAFFGSLNPRVSSVLVGVSGGADSVALIHLLHLYKERLGISRLAIAHVNHSLRGAESDGDEEFVRETAACLQIEFFNTRLSPSTNIESGIEDWARGERYSFFHHIKLTQKIDRVATAHTANDQAETLIMRIMRGAGVRGMRGVLPVRGDGVIRPLLSVERHHLEEWLKTRGLSYRVDSSNSNQKFRRNWVRSEIIPKMVERNRDAVANIASSAASAGRVWEIVMEKVNIWISSHVIRGDEFSFYIIKSGLLDEGIASEAIVTLFDEYEITVSKLHVRRVISAKALFNGEHLLPDGWGFYPSRDRILFMRRDKRQQNS
jgi:tRNA(Ile)-lysidine synthase